MKIDFKGNIIKPGRRVSVPAGTQCTARVGLNLRRCRLRAGSTGLCIRHDYLKENK